MIISTQNKLLNTYVVNEDGTLLYSFNGYSYIFNTPTGARLHIYPLTAPQNYDKVYSLPGKIYPQNVGQKGAKRRQRRPRGL